MPSGWGTGGPPQNKWWYYLSLRGADSLELGLDLQNTNVCMVVLTVMARADSLEIGFDLENAKVCWFLHFHGPLRGLGFI
mgnify:CR=1 FL=1